MDVCLTSFGEMIRSKKARRDGEHYIMEEGCRRIGCQRDGMETKD